MQVGPNLIIDARDAENYFKMYNAAKKLTKNPEQRKVLCYFMEQNCCVRQFNCLKDEEYEKLVSDKVASLKLRDRALAKIGLDEDEVNEIPPVNFFGYIIDNNLVRQTLSGAYVSSSWQSSWLFFSQTQLYFYSFAFCMCADSKQETTEEYFYKDITSLSTLTDSIKPKWFAKKEACILMKKGVASQSIDTVQFQLVVPGDKFRVAMQGDEESERLVHAMKQQVRDRKNS